MKTPSRRILLPAIPMALVLATVLLWFWGAVEAAHAERRPVRVGLYENAPKVYTDATGRPAGLFVELLEAIARAEGWRLSYEPCDWAVCLERLERGELDLMPDVAFSAERAQRRPVSAKRDADRLSAHDALFRDRQGPQCRAAGTPRRPSHRLAPRW